MVTQLHAKCKFWHILNHGLNRVEVSADARLEVDNHHILTIILDMESSNRCFDIIYPSEVKQHLQAIERKYYALIRSEIEAQLRVEPDVETRNRKP